VFWLKFEENLYCVQMWSVTASPSILRSNCPRRACEQNFDGRLELRPGKYCAYDAHDGSRICRPITCILCCSFAAGYLYYYYSSENIGCRVDLGWYRIKDIGLWVSVSAVFKYKLSLLIRHIWYLSSMFRFFSCIHNVLLCPGMCPVFCMWLGFQHFLSLSCITAMYYLYLVLKTRSVCVIYLSGSYRHLNWHTSLLLYLELCLIRDLNVFFCVPYTVCQLSVAVMELICDSFHISSGGCEGDLVEF
jgi:hypothetical protein